MDTPAPPLTRGQNTALPAGSVRLQVVVGWSDPEGGHDLDLSALLLGGDGRVRSDHDMVFYNQPVSADGAVRHQGGTASDAGAEARLAIDLEALDPGVRTVAVVASPATGTFADVQDVVLTLLDATSTAQVRYPLAGLGVETAVHLGELYRREDQWRFRAVGQGWASGLAGLATDFGIDVSEGEGEDDPAPEAGAVVPPAGPAVAEPASAPAAVTATSRVRKGVRTKRVTPIRVPAPTLADDERWEPARLFSVSGVGAAQEQERRATSALLSCMVAVRRFGRAVTAHLGAPAGPLETFLEVPFKLGEHTVQPDGVIKVARGGRVWTALLEVKTGTGQLRVDQVEHYLDVARARGYDAVVTLSNEIAPAAGVHPVDVDGRKLKKVALHHLSWAEVLHEARMLLDHRGAEDQLQAWLLHEYIRYLTHPRSGAVGFQDMGSSWVAVREAVAAGTVRPSDRKMPAVAESWARLVRHLCLQLTADLGVDVREVVPRRAAGEPASRITAWATQLAETGTLDATVKVPDAAGPLTVVADLRTSRVRVSVDVAAPGEGGGARRVGWMLRQLKDAPGTLLVEVRFRGGVESTCELLKDVREEPGVLLADRSAEVASFRLTSTSPLGTKRSGLKGAFVPSVTSAVEEMYRGVVQPVRAWVPPAPRLPDGVPATAPEDLVPDP